MGARFVNVDWNTPLLFPTDLREWLPEDHLVHFIIEAVEQLDVSSFKVNESGSEQYPPEMMVILLLYCYATGPVKVYPDVVSVLKKREISPGNILGRLEYEIHMMVA
jgi:hypothetical protein